jgi:hypothetical protein
MASISSAVSAQVQLCQIPNAFSRYAGFDPNCAALRAKSAGMDWGAPEGAITLINLYPPFVGDKPDATATS